MQQRNDVPQRKPWLTWVFIASTVLNTWAAVEALLIGDYWPSLTYASVAGIFGLMAAKADLRGGAWVAALTYSLLGVGALAAVVTLFGG